MFHLEGDDGADGIPGTDGENGTQGPQGEKVKTYIVPLFFYWDQPFCPF